MQKYLQKKLACFFSSSSKKPDKQRKGFILNVLLLGSILLVFIAIALMAFPLIEHEEGYNGASIFLMPVVLSIFIFLFILSKKGFQKISAYLFIVAYLIPITYALSKWGVALSGAMMVCCLLVVIAGILLGARVSLILTILISLIIYTLTLLEAHQYIPSFAPLNKHRIDDVIIQSAILLIISIVAWLHLRETENAIQRAQVSENDLKNERISLEIKVQKRTMALRKSQLDEMRQFHRFAELGKLTSGLFHEIINPLTSLLLSLEQIESTKTKKSTALRISLEKAIQSTRRIENFIYSTQKQIKQQEDLSSFYLAKEIKEAIQIFDFKIRKTNIQLLLNIPNNLSLYGNPLKFDQIISNLLSNAVDAFEEVLRKNKEISISLEEKKDFLQLLIKDNAGGIAPQNIGYIFLPFFTTKSAKQGTGIGLSMVKEIIEKDFQGTIDVLSRKNLGTTFVIKLPKKTKPVETGCFIA